MTKETKKRPCKTCERQPDEKNHPTGMIFVGWGRGWEPCVKCKGTGFVEEEAK